MPVDRGQFSGPRDAFASRRMTSMIVCFLSRLKMRVSLIMVPAPVPGLRQGMDVGAGFFTALTELMHRLGQVTMHQIRKSIETLLLAALINNLGKCVQAFIIRIEWWLEQAFKSVDKHQSIVGLQFGRLAQRPITGGAELSCHVTLGNVQSDDCIT